jgi:sugar phosphate isomerase/epimerase
MPFKYTVVTDTMPWIGYSVLEQPQEILAAVKEAGYDCIDLPGDPVKMDGAEWRKMTQDAGLEVPELLGAWGYYHAGEERNLASTDQAKRQHAVDYAKATADLAAEIGASFVELCAAQPAIPQLPFPEDDISALRSNFKDSIRNICEHAGKCGITMLLEPLNCYEGLPGVLTTVIEAVNYVEELQLDNLGVQPDNYHMNCGESSVTQAVRRAGKHIRHYHFNETNHATHGTGHADFKEIIRILKEIGYDDYLAFYMPQTTQQIFQSTIGMGYGKSDAASTADGSDKKTLLEYLQQPLRLVKKLEATVEIERDFHELNGTRY